MGEAKFVTFLLLAIILTALAIVFPNGQKPQQVTLSNGESIIAYADGTVYTNEACDKRTLSLAGNGQLMSSFSLMGPGYLSYHEISLPATSAESAKWQLVQTLLSKKEGSQ